MAFGLGAFSATLALDTTGYTRGLLNAQALNAAFGESFTSLVANPTVFFIGTLKNLVTGFVSASASTLQYAQDIRRLSRETGVSTDLLQALQRTLEAGGVAQENAGQSISFFVQQLAAAKDAAGTAADAVKSLGVDITRLGSADDAVRTLLESIAAIADPVARAQIAVELFGRQAGPALANQLRSAGGGVRDIINEISSLGQIIDQDGVVSLSNMKDALARVEQNIDGIKRTAIVAFLEGFARNADLSTTGVDDLARSIREELTPAMESLGATAREVIKTISGFGDSDTVSGMKSILEIVLKIREASVDALSSGISFSDRFAESLANARAVADVANGRVLPRRALSESDRRDLDNLGPLTLQNPLKGFFAR